MNNKLKPTDQDSRYRQKLNGGNELNPIMSPVAAALFGLIGVFILYQFVGGILTLVIFGSDFKNANMNAVRLMTMGGQILFILFPALLLAKLVYEDVTTVIRFKLPKQREVILFSAGMIVLIPLLQNYLYLQNRFIEFIASNNPFIQQVKSFLDKIDKMVGEQYNQILNGNNLIEQLLIVLVVSVTPAICEEIFFRGFVQKSFELKLSPFVSILITSVFFGFYHFNPYGLIPLIALGAYLGYAVYQSDSIFVSMVLHFLNNFVAIMAYFSFGDEDFIKSSVLPANDILMTSISFAVLLVLFSAIIMYIRKDYSSNKNEANYDLS